MQVKNTTSIASVYQPLCYTIWHEGCDVNISRYCNQTLADELEQLVGRMPADTKVDLVLTAALAEQGNKDWFLEQINKLRKYGWQWIDIVDITNPSIDQRKRLNEVDVAFVSGGNTFYLFDAMRRAKFYNCSKMSSPTKSMLV